MFILTNILKITPFSEFQYSYGITSDPLTQFAVLLAAVIHDVDHQGISNADLCRENELLAKIFDGKSVAGTSRTLNESIRVAFVLFSRFLLFQNKTPSTWLGKH